MSARGARSRKVQQKDIEKREKKIAIKGKAVEESVPHDKLAKLRLTHVSNNAGNASISRSATVSSHATSRSSSTNNNHGGLHLNIFRSSGSTENRALRMPWSPKSDSASTSGISEEGWGRPGYDTNALATSSRLGRRETRAKSHAAASHLPTQSKIESVGSHLSFPNQKSWQGFKVWEGAKEHMRPYGGFDVDQDMQHGSVLIYFKEEQEDEDRPLPSLRADLKTLENAGSTWISNALLYGHIDNDDDEWMLPHSPESMLPSQPVFQENIYNEKRRMLLPVSPGGQSPPLLDIDQFYGPVSPKSTSSAPPYPNFGRSERSISPQPFQQSNNRNPTHEIWFTAPGNTRTSQEQRLHYVAVRNYLAMLHDKPIVGADLFDMLNTLQPEIQIMYDFDAYGQSSITPRERSVQMLTNYLGQYEIDDIRNNPRDAISLLAWSEQESVKWRQGYLESFVHLVGLLDPHVEALPEFKHLSTVTRRNLGIASKTLQLRVMEAEEKLSTFEFRDLWGDISKVTNSPVYQSYQSFRQFLTDHYAQRYGKWPPNPTNFWLDRKLVTELQDDFGSLYDYLVDRDVVWSPCEERASRKWEMSNRRLDDFKADSPELGITDMLVGFDGKHGFAHIPHPYPLLPKDVSKGAKESKKSLFASLKRDKHKAKVAAKDAKTHLQLSIVFGDATNVEKLGANYAGSALIDEFERLELSTNLKHSTPREARLGHWVLLYGILQLLSTLSVDAQGLQHTHDVRYFLCAHLKRCPEWVTDGHPESLQDSQQRSWCWQRAWDPSLTQTTRVELDAPARNDVFQEDDDLGSIVDGYRSTPSFPPPPTPSLDGATYAHRTIPHTREYLDANLPAYSPSIAHPPYADTSDRSIHPALRGVQHDHEFGSRAGELEQPVSSGYDASGRGEEA